MPYATTTQMRDYLPQIPTYGQQTVTVTGGPSGGTFTLSYEGVETATIAYDATAGVVQAALVALTAIGTAVKVSGPAGGPWLVDFSGNTGRSPLALDTSALTGGTTPSVAITNTTDALLTTILARATDIVRNAMRAELADPAFDYAAWPAASARVVRGYSGDYLTLPPHQAGSVTLVEYATSTNPETWGAITDSWAADADGRLYRAVGWQGAYSPRYRVTAVWGYGPTVPAAIEELTLEVAVNLWRSRDKGGFTEIVGVEGGGGLRMVAGLNKLQQQIVTNVAAQLWQVGV